VYDGERDKTGTGDCGLSVSNEDRVPSDEGDYDVLMKERDAANRMKGIVDTPE